MKLGMPRTFDQIKQYWQNPPFLTVAELKNFQ